MSNFNNNIKDKAERKQKENTRQEKLAGYFYDLSKLCLAGLVVGVVVPLYSDVSNENNWYSVCTGIILTIMLAVLANKILK